MVILFREYSFSLMFVLNLQGNNTLYHGNLHIFIYYLLGIFHGNVNRYTREFSGFGFCCFYDRSHTIKRFFNTKNIVVYRRYNKFIQIGSWPSSAQIQLRFQPVIKFLSVLIHAIIKNKSKYTVLILDLGFRV